MALSKPKNSPYYKTRFSICGVRVQESTRCTTKREAQEYEDKRRKEIRDQVLFGKKPQKTWPEAVMRWLDEMKHKRSFDTDISRFKVIQPFLGKYYLNDINKDLLDSIADKRTKKGTSPATINRMFALIRAVMNRAYKQWGWIDRVPAFPMKKEKNNRIRWLTVNEAQRLLNELPIHLMAMAKFTLATGLRSKNVSQLKWENINLIKRHAVVHSDEIKNGKALGVPLNDDAMDVLNSLINDHPEYVFVYKGKPVTNCSSRAWRKALKRASIENFRWHDLRHTWASWHVQSGTTLQELFELGGWASFSMVLRYAHLSSNQLKNAADRISGLKLVHKNLKVV